MCMHGGTFLSSKPSRQAYFTAGYTTMCQRCHAKMNCNTSLLVKKGRHWDLASPGGFVDVAGGIKHQEKQ